MRWTLSRDGDESAPMCGRQDDVTDQIRRLGRLRLARPGAENGRGHAGEHEPIRPRSGEDRPFGPDAHQRRSRAMTRTGA